MRFVEKSLVEIVLKEEYGISAVSDISPIPLGSQGWKFRVISQRECFVFRMLTPPKPRYLNYALMFQQEVADRTDLAPAVVRTTNGQLSAEAREYECILERHLPGVTRSVKAAEAHTCGCLLARIHSVAKNVDIQSSPAAWEFLSGMSYAHVQALASCGSRCKMQAADFLHNWTTSMELLSKALVDDFTIPKGSHGDVNPTNMLWDDGQMRFCDFVNASPLPQFTDIAMGVIGLGVLEWDFRKHTERMPSTVGHDVATIQAFLSAYNETRRLLPREKGLLPNALRMLWGYWSRWFPSRNKLESDTIQRLSAELDEFVSGTFTDLVDNL